MQIDRRAGWVERMFEDSPFSRSLPSPSKACMSCKNTEDNKYALSSPRQMVSPEVMSEASLVFLERTDVRERSIQTFQSGLLG